MSMNILRATKLKYGAIHSAEPKQMCGTVGHSYYNYFNLLHTLRSAKSDSIKIIDR